MQYMQYTCDVYDHVDYVALPLVTKIFSAFDPFRYVLIILESRIGPTGFGRFTICNPK